MQVKHKLFLTMIDGKVAQVPIHKKYKIKVYSLWCYSTSNDNLNTIILLPDLEMKILFVTGYHCMLGFVAWK